MAHSQCASISRRRFLQTTSLAAAAGWLGAGNLFGQATDAVSQMRAAGATAKITVQPARRNVSVLLGSGGNIAVLTGKDGKLLVDSGLATSQRQINEALNFLSADPLKHLIDTHWHFDHTDGNEWMHAAGATIIAHENTKRRLSTPQVIAAFNASFPAAPAGAIPSLVFATTDSFHTNGETIEMTHYAPAHTDTDISVHFIEADILHCGDTWFNGNYPFIDYSSGGNIDGMIKATAANLERSTAKTIIIPGHGPVGDRAQLAEYHEMLTTIRENVAALKRQGRPLEVAIAEKPTHAFDLKWGNGLINGDTFTRLVFQGISNFRATRAVPETEWSGRLGIAAPSSDS
jgi:glyoxylase-like metal-dependent hydrolase (beta-lactamase superfamily II)